MQDTTIISKNKFFNKTLSNDELLIGSTFSKNIFLKNDQSLLVVGEGATEKTEKFAIPKIKQAIQKETNIIVTDNKNEIQQKTERELMQKQYTLIEVSNEDINIFEYLTENNIDDYCDIVLPDGDEVDKTMFIFALTNIINSKITNNITANTIIEYMNGETVKKRFAFTMRMDIYEDKIKNIINHIAFFKTNSSNYIDLTGINISKTAIFIKNSDYCEYNNKIAKITGIFLSVLIKKMASIGAKYIMVLDNATNILSNSSSRIFKDLLDVIIHNIVFILVYSFDCLPGYIISNVRNIMFLGGAGWLQKQSKQLFSKTGCSSGEFSEKNKSQYKTVFALVNKDTIDFMDMNNL